MAKRKLRIERKLRIQFICALFGAFLFSLFMTLCIGVVLQKINHPVVSWLELRIEWIYALVLFICILSIFYYFWSKPWQYLDEVVQVSTMMNQKNEATIKLSPEIGEIEVELNQIKSRLLDQQQQVQEIENKKNDLVMYLAHDLRTPLTSVIGYLSLLKEIPDLSFDQQQKYVEVALKKSKRLEQLVNEFFELTRVSRTDVLLSKETINCYYLLEQLAEEFYPISIEKNKPIVLTGTKEGMMKIDPEKMARVFGNILKNALNYGKKEKPILIELIERKEFIEILFSNEVDSISDDERIWTEQFYRSDRARRSDNGGAGLGLTIAQMIVQQHMGEMSIRRKDHMIECRVVLPKCS